MIMMVMMIMTIRIKTICDIINESWIIVRMVMNVE